jgi:prepilin-type N-terminal cleavage/methylation domain-containing protein
MWKLKNWHNNKGFTIVELAVTMGIIAVLSGIGLVTFSKLTATNQQTKCINNLRTISQGLQLYHNDFRTFPDDGYPYDADDLYPLSTDLAIYVPVKSTFVCPEDEDITSISDFRSYDPYYVARPASYQNEELVIGCPRHRDASCSTSLFSMGSTQLTNIDTVLANGQTIPPDGTKAQRTITAVNDVMTFADNSTVTLTNASGGDYGCFLIQSVRLADGTLYSIVRVQDDGTIDVSVNSGSKFEIVTPSAVVGVRGTKFDVVTTNGGYTTNVNLTEGTVILMDSVTGETTTLTEGGLTTASAAVNMHEHPHWHANGTYVTDSHPSLNLAHHGNPALAMKLASAAGGGGGEEDPEDPEDPEISPEDQALIDLILAGASTTKQKQDLRNALVAASPLSDAVLIALINNNPLTSAYILPVFEANVPLSDTIWLAMIAVDDILLSAAYGDLFELHSTISDTVLLAAIDKGTIMLSTAWQNTLIDKGTLSDDVLIAALNEGTIMDSSSYFLVLQANIPVSDDVLNVPITTGVMSNNNLWEILKLNGQLSEGLLNTLVQTETTMNSTNHAHIFVLNSPLPDSILDQICAGYPVIIVKNDRDWIWEQNLQYTCP